MEHINPSEKSLRAAIPDQAHRRVSQRREDRRSSCHCYCYCYLPYLLKSIAYLAKPLASRLPSDFTRARPIAWATASLPGAERKTTGPWVATLTKLQLW